MTVVSTFGRAHEQAENLKNLLGQVNDLQTQLATGKKTQSFSGLGPDVMISERSRANLKSLGQYDTNIAIGLHRLDMMNTSIQSIQQQAKSVVSAMETQTEGGGDLNMDAIHSLASNALSFIQNLLNQKDGDRYLFGGAETTTRPITDDGTLDTYEKNNIAAWAATTMTTDQLIASYTNTNQLTDTIMGYSTPLASGNARNVTVKADDGAEVDYTVFANDPTLRDIVATLTMIINVTGDLDKVSSDPGDPPGTVTAPGADASAQKANFYQLYNDLAGKLNTAAFNIAQIGTKIGFAQADLKTIKDNHELDKNVLKTNIADVEDADMNDIAVKISSLQVQLQASYQLTASMQQYSLAFALA